jgi:signal transduction histidine kinase
MCAYRVLFGLVLLVWLGMTALLALEPVNLVTVRFSSAFALVWFVGGLILAALLLIGFGRRGYRPQGTGYLPLISANLTEGIIICNSRGRIQWSNEGAAQLINGNQLNDTIKPLFERAKSSRRIAIENVTIGEGLRLSVQALPLDRGTFTITSRPLQTDSTRSTFYENFIRRIVHDMRNPLAAIIGHSANIQQSPVVEAEAWRKSAATIENEAQRLARLVDSMLFDARLAYVPLELARIDLVDVLEEAVYARDEMAQREAKSLKIEAPPTAMRAEGDRDLLVRAFENLIDNGLKYSEAGGSVYVHLQEQPNLYVIEFIDNGSGIPPEYLPDRIFEPLVRAGTQKGGSGLGLSICKKIVEMHGGSISAQSKVGKGTTMTIRLPKPVEDEK